MFLFLGVFGCIELYAQFEVEGSGVRRETYAETPESDSLGSNEWQNMPNAAHLAPVLDGCYKRVAQQEREVLPYPYLREADVFWQKRIWRVIDTRQKMNQTFMYPVQPFITVLLDIAKQSGVRLFSDDTFTQTMSYSDIEKMTGSTDTILVTDVVSGREETKVVHNDFDPQTVTHFRLKEDWIFDKQRSEMVVRILGIAPIQTVYDEQGNYRGDRALFWAYYPDFRKYLVKYETFNPQNDAVRLTWDDVLEMRYFASYIMKESNVLDRRIQDYATDRDALLESERVKNDIFSFEQNLWSY